MFGRPIYHTPASHSVAAPAFKWHRRCKRLLRVHSGRDNGEGAEPSLSPAQAAIQERIKRAKEYKCEGNKQTAVVNDAHECERTGFCIQTVS